METTEEENIKNAYEKEKQELLEKIMSLNICANESPEYFACYEVLKDDIKKIILTGKSELFEIKTYNDGLCEGRKQGIERGKQEAFCLTCGFPKGWERSEVFLTDDIFSLMNMEENICEECGHQKDGYTIKKIESLLRRFKEAGRKEAVEDEVKFLEEENF